MSENMARIEVTTLCVKINTPGTRGYEYFIYI